MMEPSDLQPSVADLERWWVSAVSMLRDLKLIFAGSDTPRCVDAVKMIEQAREILFSPGVIGVIVDIDQRPTVALSALAERDRSEVDKISTPSGRRDSLDDILHARLAGQLGDAECRLLDALAERDAAVRALESERSAKNFGATAPADEEIYRGRSGSDVLAPGPALSSQRMLDDAARALGWRTDFACGDSRLHGCGSERDCASRSAYAPGITRPDITSPIPMYLWCPSCGGRHIDVGEFATKPHHTHSCQHAGCGLT